MKVTRTPSMMQKILWRCDDYHANTIILNQAMGYVLSEKTECVATLVGGYCTSSPISLLASQTLQSIPFHFIVKEQYNKNALKLCAHVDIVF